MKKLSSYKKEAKTFQKNHSLKLHQAQLSIAQEYGFTTWSELVHASKSQTIAETSLSQVEESFLSAEDLAVTHKMKIPVTITSEDLKSGFCSIPDTLRPYLLELFPEHIDGGVDCKLTLVGCKDDVVIEDASGIHLIRLFLIGKDRQSMESFSITNLKHNAKVGDVLRFVILDGVIELIEFERQGLERNKVIFGSKTKEQVFLNKKKLVSLAIDFSVFEPTATGLKKSILDATQPVRTLFSEAGFHDYDSQEQGPDHKVIKKAFFISPAGLTETTVSLYRPNTKSGDPRMWFRGLGKFAKAGAQVSLSIVGDDVLLINLSDVDLQEADSFVIGKLLELIPNNNSIAQELLEKLKVLARGEPLKATVVGSTAVGRAIETALGIDINSSKEPDYNGIELKSGRGGNNRTTLFAQVADWKQSPLDKSVKILDQFGYYRGDDFKLYCTISARKPNSQGLQFNYDEKADLLTETNTDFGDVAVWPGKLLRSRLLKKHKETFWIHAESIDIDGTEHFKLISVTHTKNPMCNQLMPLLRDGVITMDHLIKRRASDGRVSEKGPLFKMNKKDLSLLFPEPITYILDPIQKINE